MEENELHSVPKVFEIQITAAGQKVSETFELDKSVKKVHGVAFSSEKPDLMYHRGYARLEINNKEYFPDNHAVQRVMNGINANLDNRYWPLKKVIIGNGKVKIEYTDKPDGRTVFAAYTVLLYFDCEIVID
ncbi:MAG TPA: hypothetical protein DEP18_01835 [Flavobacteriales bacterium]|nr:hypothetical protein [Flavobacteriales bacterium]HRE97744.1 hypothetical protein [Flavobacteriales bacterium]HRJ35915.1 hypothetical protein [Flavobacteriales bacterium]HRJ39374.1 hypothetical protein [Flavobacteriales bacterium]